MTGDTQTQDDPRHMDRGVARKHAFLEAAREVFLEQGYEAASVNDVVRRAGGSLATLYAQFGNKEGLFLAVMEDQHQRFAEAITPRDVDHLPREQALQVLGEQFTRAILERDSLAFFRLIVGEGRKFPQLLQRYTSQSGLELVRGVVADQIERTSPGVKNATRYAAYFIELLRSHHQYVALADESYVLSEPDLKQHVAHAVRFILTGMDAEIAG